MEGQGGCGGCGPGPQEATVGIQGGTAQGLQQAHKGQNINSRQKSPNGQGEATADDIVGAEAQLTRVLSKVQEAGACPVLCALSCVPCQFTDLFDTVARVRGCVVCQVTSFLFSCGIP